MAKYESPIAKTYGNIVIKKDGSIWATYILDGINVSSLQERNASSDAHRRLFKALKGDAEEIRLHSLKGRVPVEETMDRISKGMPKDFLEDVSRYPLLHRKVSTIFGLMKERRLRQFRRVYILAVRIPNPSVKSGFMSMFVNVDTSAMINPKDFSRNEKKIFERIPKDFNPRRSNDQFLQFAHDRGRFRGLTVPEIPSMSTGGSFNTKNGFSPIVLDGRADTVAMTEDLVRMVREEDPDLATNLKDAYAANYRTLKYSVKMSVHNPEHRTPDLPDGPVSYQQHSHVVQWPLAHTDFNLFHIADDGSTGLDVDWTIRWVYTDDLDKNRIAVSRANLKDKEKTSRDDEDDHEDNRQRSEIDQWSDLRFDDYRDHTAMRVSVMFTFGAPALWLLSERMEQLEESLRSRHGIILQTVPGAFQDDYQQSLPCNPASKLMISYEQATTIGEFSGCGMLHTTNAGDKYGLPIAICTEDDNGTFIHMDYLGRPDRGNPSEIFEGSQGSGKSYTLKSRASDLLALHAIVHSFDPSAHGEYEKFFASLRNVDPFITVESVNLAAGRVSFDPVKVYADDLELMKVRFQRLMMPLLELDADSKVAEILLRGLTERNAYNIHSTRDLIDNYVTRFSTGMDNTGIKEEIEKVRLRANHISQLPYGRSMIDPVGVDIPVINVKATAINFRVYGLEFPDKDDKIKDMSTEKLLTQALMDSAALFTSYRFAFHKGLCATVVDEVHTFSSSPTVIKQLVEKPMRMGRKESNLFYGGSQEPEHFTEGFKEVANHTIHRLDREESARAAVVAASLPEDPALIHAIRVDTAPLVPGENFITPGREGECWYVSAGSTPVRAKVLPMMLGSAAKAADTTASSMRES